MTNRYENKGAQCFEFDSAKNNTDWWKPRAWHCRSHAVPCRWDRRGRGSDRWSCCETRIADIVSKISPASNNQHLGHRLSAGTVIAVVPGKGEPMLGGCQGLNHVD